MSANEAPERQRVTHTQLRLILDAHLKFMLSKPGGRRAQLQFHDLSGLIMSGSNLKGADFTGALLVGADLSECQLEDAIFFAPT